MTHTSLGQTEMLEEQKDGSEISPKKVAVTEPVSDEEENKNDDVDQVDYQELASGISKEDVV